MKRKRIDGSYLLKFGARISCDMKYVPIVPCGFASLTKMESVPQRLSILFEGKEVCLACEGYSWLCFLPELQNWCMTAMYDQAGGIIEWYFDITKSNFIDENGDPSYDDLYLDIVLLPDGRVLTLDEDELIQAYEHKSITENELQLAYRVHAQLLRDKIVDIPYISSLCNQLLTYF
jgi:predicted RNA-binding protein associated with RNAse of E/G family